MAALDDLKERLRSEWEQTSARIQESALFIKLKDRYENLTPPMQKVVNVTAVILVLVILLSTPLTWFMASQEQVDLFTSRRALITDLLKAARDAQSVSVIPIPPSSSSLKSMITEQLKSAQLLPEQIISVDSTNDTVEGIRPDLVSGLFQVNLSKLNLRQVVDIGHQLQGINPSVKVKDLTVEASNELGYFNVIYHLLILNVPEMTSPSIPDEPPPPRPGRPNAPKPQK